MSKISKLLALLERRLPRHTRWILAGILTVFALYHASDFGYAIGRALY